MIVLAPLLRLHRLGGLVAAAVVWGVLLAAAPDAAAATGWRADLSAGGGYDDDVLGRPGEDSSFPILANAYAQLAPSLRGWLTRGAWRLSGGWDYVFNAYESADAGLYHDNRGRLGAAFAPARRVRLGLDGQAQWFHRSEFQDYDFDRLEIAPSVAWRLDDAWRLDAAWRHGRTTYPERTAGPLNPDDQRDEPDEYELTLGWEPTDRWFVSLGGAVIDVGSNSRQYEYAGTRWSAEGTFAPGRGWTFGASIARENRDYERFLYPQRRPGREDASWAVAVDVERTISATTRLFAGASVLDYTSELEDYAFDQARLSAGVTVRLGRPAAGGAVAGMASLAGLPPAATDPMAPAIDGTRVTFRCRAPGATTVHLVGSFNDWDPDGVTMAAGRDGVWEVAIPVGPGLHRYIFLADGTRWITPEGATFYEDDDFGQRNGVIDVPPPVTGDPADGPTDGNEPR
jgi:hypothetical protein